MKTYQMVVKKYLLDGGYVIIRKRKNGLYQVRWTLDGEGVTMHFTNLKEAFNEYYSNIRFINIVLAN